MANEQHCNSSEIKSKNSDKDEYKIFIDNFIKEIKTSRITAYVYRKIMYKFLIDEYYELISKSNSNIILKHEAVISHIKKHHKLTEKKFLELFNSESN